MWLNNWPKLDAKEQVILPVDDSDIRITEKKKENIYGIWNQDDKTKDYQRELSRSED